MNKKSFKKLFLRIGADAIEQARATTSQNVPSEFIVEMHGGKGSTGQGRLMTVDEAVDALYISKTQFYIFIDVFAKSVRGNQTILFVRPSGHESTSFEKTCNTPEGNGPFKVMPPVDLKIVS
jgi:hypothetical protein